MSLHRLNGENGEIGNFDYGWKTTYTYKTLTSTTNAGNEQRRARWEHPIRSYNLEFGNKTTTKLKALQQFFRDRKGSYEAFLFFDDNSDSIQTITDGYKIINGGYIDQFYLPYTNVYPLDSLPVVGTDIKVFIDDIERITDINYSRTSDTITFSANKPVSTAKVTVQYKYYVKVRFESDKLGITEKTWQIGDASVNLIEVR